jgi:hypothetical protein
MDKKCANDKMAELEEVGRLIAAENARLNGIHGYTITEFYQNMFRAIKSVERSVPTDTLICE